MIASKEKAMAIAKYWNGRIMGTNTGNVSVTFDGEDNALVGIIRLNDNRFGPCVYDFTGTFDGSSLAIAGTPRNTREDIQLGVIQVTGRLNAEGDIQGTWSSSLETGGTFMLYPHNSAGAAVAAEAQASAIKQPEQLHTAREHLGPIEIQYADIIGLAEEVQQEFTKPVVVTLWGITEQSMWLADFKNLPIHIETARLLKIFASDPDQGGVNKVVSIEFGPEVNVIMVQGANESWVLGKVQTLNRDLKRFKRSYFSNVLQKFGINFGAVLLIGAVIFLPEIRSIYQRAILLIGVVVINQIAAWAQRTYIPHAAIYIKKSESALGNLWRKGLSWLIGIVGAVLTAILVAYFKGLLNLPKLP
jgi:hypothetical protein